MKKAICGVVLACVLCGVLYAANEITAVITFKVEKGYLSYSRALNTQFTLTNANPNVSGLTQDIGTTPTLISMGSVATPHWAFFRNLGTNTILLGSLDASTNLVVLIRLKTSEYGLIPLGTNVIYAQGTPGTAVLEKAIVDE